MGYFLPLWIWAFIFFTTQGFADDSYSLKTTYKAHSETAKFAKDKAASLLERNSGESIEKAIELLEAEVLDPTFAKRPIQEQVSIFIMLMDAYQKNKNYALIDAFASSLLKEHTYAAHAISLKVHWAKLMLYQGRIEDAEKLFSELMLKPKRQLSSRDAEKIADLFDSLQKAYDNIACEADHLFHQKSYAKARPLFQLLFSACSRQRFPRTHSGQCKWEFLAQLRYRMALCAYFCQEYAECLELCLSQDNEVLLTREESKKLFWRFLVLFAMASKKMESFDQALETFELVIGSSDTIASETRLKLSLEAAFCAIKTDRFERANQILSHVEKCHLDARLKRELLRLHFLYAIERGDTDRVQRLFTECEQNIQKTPFFYELQLLKGYFFYKARDYKKAFCFLELALTGCKEQNQFLQHPCYQEDALYLSGMSCMRLAKEENDPKHYVRSKEFFEKLGLSDQKKWQKIAFLSQCKLTFFAYEHTHDSLWQELHVTLKQNAPADLQYEVALECACADAAGRYGELKALASSQNRLQEGFLEGYSHLAFLELSAAKTKGAPELREIAYTRLREISSELFQSTNVTKRHRLFTENIGKLLSDDAPESFQLAYELLQSYELLLDKRGDLERVQASLFLELLALFKLQDDAFFHLADHFHKLFPKSLSSSKVHFLKALFFFQKKEYAEAFDGFMKLADSGAETQTDLKDEALFYAARSCELLKKPIEETKALYLRHFTSFCESHYAPESYFRFFSEADYIRGKPDALMHLKKMPKELQRGPFHILALYYMATNLKQECEKQNLTEAQCRLLQEVLERFDVITFEIEKEKTCVSAEDKSMLQKIELQIGYERAETLLLIANTGAKRLESFEECLASFEKVKTSIADTLRSAKSSDFSYLSSIWQKASWQRSRVFVLQGKEQDAQQELGALLATSSNWQILQAEVPIQAFCELATYKMRNGEIQEAETLLQQAEEIQQKSADRRLLLQVWLTQSMLARKRQKYDQAMMLLSKIINDDSASSIRVQAMYLRGETYELKGRRDLARRQFAACAKKGGHWAIMAKRKLEVFYGYD